MGLFRRCTCMSFRFFLRAFSRCSCVRVITLLLFCLTQCHSQEVPREYVAPLCTANSSFVPISIQIEMTKAYSLSPPILMNVTVPADFHDGFIQLPDYEKGDPSESISAQITVQLTSLTPSAPSFDYPAGVVSSYYEDESSDEFANQWMTFIEHTQGHIQFFKTQRHNAPYGFSQAESFLLLFTPLMTPNGTDPYLQLNLSCAISFHFNMNCCSTLQPMQLAAQPYWILMLSTITYFAASYLFVYISIALNRFQLWRSTVASIKACLHSTFCWHSGCRGGVAKENDADIPHVVPMTAVSESNQRTALFDPLLAPTEFHATSPRMEEDAVSDPAVSKPESISDRLMQANAWFLVLQFLLAMANLVYLILKFSVLKKSSLDQQLSHWESFESVYLFWTNSSVSTLLATSAASHITMKYQRYQILKLTGVLPAPDKNGSCRGACRCGCCCQCCRSGWSRLKVFLAVDIPRDRLICRHIVVGILILLSPAILTHVLPMSVFFFPFVIIAFGVMALTFLIVYGIISLTERAAVPANNTSPSIDVVDTPIEAQRNDIDSDSDMPTSRKVSVEFPWYSLLLFRLICTITVILFVQTLYNYGTLTWKSMQSFLYAPEYVFPYVARQRTFSEFAKVCWFETIAHEYSQRSSQLYAQIIEHDLFEKIRAITMFL